MKRVVLTLLFILALAAAAPKQELVRAEGSVDAMGSTYSVVVYGPDRELAGLAQASHCPSDHKCSPPRKMDSYERDDYRGHQRTHSATTIKDSICKRTVLGTQKRVRHLEGARPIEGFARTK